MVSKSKVNQKPSPTLADSSNAAILEDRQREILKLLAMSGSVKVGELSRRFAVSEVTIRTDLERLARQGSLVRFRGGAVAKVDTSQSTAFSERVRNRQAEKERIARKAIEYVQPGDALFLDAGSTVLEFAKLLGTCVPLTIVTTAVNTAALLASVPGIHVIMAGGSLTPETISTVGQIAERDISDLLGDKVFLGVHSFCPELGIVDVSVEVARVKNAMIRAARQVIVLADSSKYQTRTLARVAPITAVNTLITDIGLSDEATDSIVAQGVDVVRV